MKTFFDTSVLVAAMVDGDPRHTACFKLLRSADDGWLSVHTLAECFATLTGGR